MARPSSQILCGSSLRKTSLSSSRFSFTRASGCLLAMIPLLTTALFCSRTFSELPATFSWLWSLSALATTWTKASCLATPLASLASTSLGAASLSQEEALQFGLLPTPGILLLSAPVARRCRRSPCGSLARPTEATTTSTTTSTPAAPPRQLLAGLPAFRAALLPHRSACRAVAQVLGCPALFGRALFALARLGRPWHRRRPRRRDYVFLTLPHLVM